jgi:hypothetical protein
MAQTPRKHSHPEPKKPTLKELFNKQQITGYLETAHTHPIEKYV